VPLEGFAAAAGLATVMPDTLPDPLEPAVPAITAQGIFATTEWTMVLNAGQADCPAAMAALERLCRRLEFPYNPIVELTKRIL